jgi:DNA-binding response OmpR family regulator
MLQLERERERGRERATPHSLLLVEDDDSMRKLMAAFFKSQGYNVSESATLRSAARLLHALHFDAVILDLQLEDGEGYDLLRERVKDKDGPKVIVVSVRDQVSDRIVSLELGADDYLSKPVDLRELALRVRRSLRRDAASAAGRPTRELLDLDGDTRLNVADRSIVREGGSPVRLANREFRLLLMFLDASGAILAREAISRSLYGRRERPESRSIDVLVCDLRRKLNLAKVNFRIKTIRGEGYVAAIE